MGPTDQSILGNLAHKTIRADLAVKCCETNGRVLQVLVRRVIGEVFDLLNSPKDRNLILALVPGVGTSALPEISVIEVGAAEAVPGVVVLLSALDLASILQEKVAYDTLSAVQIAVDAALTTWSSNCEACVRVNMFSQLKSRKTIEGKVRKRI